MSQNQIVIETQDTEYVIQLPVEINLPTIIEVKAEKTELQLPLEGVLPENICLNCQHHVFAHQMRGGCNETGCPCLLTRFSGE